MVFWHISKNFQKLSGSSHFQELHLFQLLLLFSVTENEEERKKRVSYTLNPFSAKLIFGGEKKKKVFKEIYSYFNFYAREKSFK